MLEVVCSGEKIRYSYGPRTVLREVSLALHEGDIALLVGVNGAGKSTLLRVLSGLLRPLSGELMITERGMKPGYLGHQLQLYSEFTVEETLRLQARLTGKDEPSILEHAVRWSLDSFISERIGTLSRGQQWRVALCRALYHSPSLVMLDEPSASLDAQSVAHVMHEVQGMVQNGAALIATHDVERLLPFANRVILLSEGTVREDSARQRTDSAIEEVLQSYRKELAA